MKKPFYERSNITDENNPINITYDELLHKSNTDIDTWIDELRDYVITQWDDNGQPPVIGQDEDTIIKNWKKLFGYDVDSFFDEENLVVKNFNKFASGVNQFFPTMLKTKISSGVSSEGATSIYDHFKEDYLRDHFRKAMLRGLFKDSMYSFGKSVIRDEMGMTIEEFFVHYNNNEKKGITILQMRDKDENSDEKYLILTADELKGYIDSGHIVEQNLRTIDNDIESFYELKNGEKRYYHYWVRLYNRKQRIFPTALQIFRLGLGQPAVNFPPLTAKFLYEHFTKHIEGDETLYVYDPSSGWGGRILGAMSSLKRIHYIGTDPNTDNYIHEISKTRYEYVADFFNNEVLESNPFWEEDQNTYHLFQDGSEFIGNNPEFQSYKGKLDLVFTSPPYFDREQYSEDKEQSFKLYPKYDSWRDDFLKPTLTNAYENLREDRYLLWNIADIKVGKNYHPLEQDSIDILLSLGAEYKGKLKMLMTSMVGVDQSNVKNAVKINGTYLKYEPIFIFYKK